MSKRAEPEIAGDRFFDAHQRETIAAAMARIIPSDDGPGAHESGTIDFLDRYLSGIGYVFAKPDGSGFEELTGKQAEAWQQRIAMLQQKYLAGIAELDRLGRALCGDAFARLSETDQDRVLTVLDRPVAVQEAERNAEAAVAYAEPGLQQMTSESDLPFFPMLVLHTRQGFYADPIYGGNQGYVGWETIGFPGPRSLAETHAGRFSTLRYFAPGASSEE